MRARKTESNVDTGIDAAIHHSLVGGKIGQPVSRLVAHEKVDARCLWTFAPWLRSTVRVQELQLESNTGHLERHTILQKYGCGA
jgi:hypothetical protein